MKYPEFSANMLLPKYWLTWIGFGIWWSLAQLPYSVQMWLGRRMAKLISIFGQKRISIAKRNLELCFPELDQSQQKDLLQKHINSLGMVFFEIGFAWFASANRLKKRVRYTGLEHLKTAEAEGVGVVLMTMHSTHLDLGASFINLQHSIDGSYREHNNKVYDFIQHRCRERFNSDTTAIETEDVRTVVKHLRKGRAVWYAPDQDYGKKAEKSNLFLPFFGVTAACISSTSDFARMGKAKVIPFFCIREENSYHILIQPPLEQFPSDDKFEDTKRIISIVENAIRMAPEQYLWVHRRFKTRPKGEPSLYKDKHQSLEQD
jgi:KDO2-lipid IV(A) lauroyltransferase